MNMDSPQSHNTSLQRLQNVEKRIVRVLELAGGVMNELAHPAGPRKELLNSHCGEFMQLIKVRYIIWPTTEIALKKCQSGNANLESMPSQCVIPSIETVNPVTCKLPGTGLLEYVATWLERGLKKPRIS